MVSSADPDQLATEEANLGISGLSRTRVVLGQTGLSKQYRLKSDATILSIQGVVLSGSTLFAATLQFIL